MVSADHEWIEGGITAVPGILATGLHAGIKSTPARDLALVYSSTPATAAGVFTTNRIVGAPVKVAAFVRYQLGEGIEKKEEDFAAEVAKTMGAAKQ